MLSGNEWRLRRVTDLEALTALAKYRNERNLDEHPTPISQSRLERWTFHLTELRSMIEEGDHLLT